MTKIQNSKHYWYEPKGPNYTCFGHAQRRRLRRVLNIEIWCLGFGICRKRINPNAFALCDVVFNLDKILLISLILYHCFGF